MSEIIEKTPDEWMELDRKIERINLIRSMMGEPFIAEDAPAGADVIAELNSQIYEFFVELLNVELGRPAKKKVVERSEEQEQALSWLLTKIVAAMNAPVVVNQAVSPVQQPAPAVEILPPEQPYGDEPSVHVPIISGRAISRNARKGSGIMDLLKQQNPDLIIPTDPQFPQLTPEARAQAERNFNEAMRSHELAKKAEVEARGGG